MKQLFFLILTLCRFHVAFAQREPDKVYMPSIHGVKLFLQNNQTAYPIIPLGAVGALELHFDDLDGYVKNYNYTFQLCNADWLPADQNVFDYIKGFTQNRLTQYRVSSIAATKYVHYQALLPENNCLPIKSGNYLLKVYLNSDTAQLAFTRRVLIVNNTVTISAQVQQPFNTDLYKTHQKLQFSIDNGRLNILNPLQQVKVVVLQNYRWDIAVSGAQPAFMRQSVYEYNGERDFVFPAGKEFRWIDLQSFRYLSDRIKTANRDVTPPVITVVPDGDRLQQRYIYYSDMDGFFTINCTDLVNPWWQGDYGTVNFTYVPPGNQPYAGKDLYIIGQMTDYKLDDNTKLTFNADKGLYEKSLLLKQGYYTYTFETRDSNNPRAAPGVELTDGNYWETENLYTVLVYYRAFSDRSDELVGVATVNSRTQRSGF